MFAYALAHVAIAPTEELWMTLTTTCVSLNIPEALSPVRWQHIDL